MSALTSVADEKVKYSARDSLSCKYSASRLKYFQDPYIEAVFSRLNESNGKVPPAQIRRSPIIHRGYYSRNESFTKVLRQFLEQTQELNSTRQVLFLGAGFDTSPLIPYHQGYDNVRTFEVDFADIISKKLEIFRSVPAITTLLSGYDAAGHKVTSSTTGGEIGKDATGSADRAAGCTKPSTIPSSCCSNPSVSTIGPLAFISQDLRNANTILTNLQECGFDGSLPTLILSECVLVYVHKEASLNLSTALAQLLQGDALWMTYDMITPNDVYGRNMIKNLHSAGFEIPGIKDFPTLEHQKNRFIETGWSDARSCSMRYYYDKLIPLPQKEVLYTLEIFDEVEEWNMLMEHYSLTIATKGTKFDEILNIIPAVHA